MKTNQELNFITWNKQDTLPLNPEPYTVYIIRDTNTFDFKIVNTNGEYIDLNYFIPSSLFEDYSFVDNSAEWNAPPEWGEIIGNIINQTDLQNILNNKANQTDLDLHINNISNPHNVTKTQVGLSNVDNTSDINKPVSTAQNLALQDKLEKGNYIGTAEDLNNSIQTAQNGIIRSDTKAEMEALTGDVDKTYTVTRDSVNDGFYSFDGSNFLFDRPLDAGEKAFNKLLDIKTYGLPQYWNNVATAQASYNPDIKAFESTRVFIANFLFADLGFTANFFAIVVSEDTLINSFRTRDSSLTIIDNATIRIVDGKKIAFVDLTKPDITRIDLSIGSNATILKLYDVYAGDENPLLDIQPYIINDEVVELEELWLSELGRKTQSVKGFKGQNISIPKSRLIAGKFKKYVFFEVEKSRPDLIMPITLRVLDSPSNLLVSRINDGQSCYIELTSQQQIDARGFLMIVSNIYQGGTVNDWVILKNVRTSDSLSVNVKPALEIPQMPTSFEGKDRGLDTFFVGKTLFTGKAPDSIVRENDLEYPSGFSDISTYNYTGEAISDREVQKVTYYDTKGTQTSGRVLLYVDKLGVMYFKDGSDIKTISVEDFESNSISHDQVGLTIDDIDFLTLPETATLQEKTDEWNRMKAEWKMLPDSEVLPLYSSAPITASLYASQFGNGSMMSASQLIRKGGEVVTPKLLDPVIGNPTHLIISDINDNVLQEIALAPHTNLKKGSMTADQGAITYGTPVDAIINFSNGKFITVPVTIGAGTYKITVRGRRYSTTLVDGSITVENDNGSTGSIVMDGNTGFNQAELVDRTATITLTSTTSIKLTAVCPTERNFQVGNGSSSRPAWGYTARGRFGTIVEYGAPPARRLGMSYFTQDNGESWRMLFDISLNELFLATNAHHMHGACYDPYWKKFYLVGGDANDDILAVLHCDVDPDLSLDNVVWKKSSQVVSEYLALIGEQYCSVYAHKDYLLFGTDMTMTGIFRMPRIDKDNLSKREPCFIINDFRITHIPTVYYQKDVNEELFVMSMKGDENSSFAPREYQCCLLHSTMDGVKFKEVWKDVVFNEGFGFNNFLKCFHYKNKLILHFFRDKRFPNNHTVAIIDYI